MTQASEKKDLKYFLPVEIVTKFEETELPWFKVHTHWEPIHR